MWIVGFRAGDENRKPMMLISEHQQPMPYQYCSARIVLDGTPIHQARMSPLMFRAQGGVMLHRPLPYDGVSSVEKLKLKPVAVRTHTLILG